MEKIEKNNEELNKSGGIRKVNTTDQKEKDTSIEDLEGGQKTDHQGGSWEYNPIFL